MGAGHMPLLSAMMATEEYPPLNADGKHLLEPHGRIDPGPTYPWPGLLRRCAEEHPCLWESNVADELANEKWNGSLLALHRVREPLADGLVPTTMDRIIVILGTATARVWDQMGKHYDNETVKTMYSRNKFIQQMQAGSICVPPRPVVVAVVAAVAAAAPPPAAGMPLLQEAAASGPAPAASLPVVAAPALLLAGGGMPLRRPPAPPGKETTCEQFQDCSACERALPYCSRCGPDFPGVDPNNMETCRRCHGICDIYIPDLSQGPIGKAPVATAAAAPAAVMPPPKKPATAAAAIATAAGMPPSPNGKAPVATAATAAVMPPPQEAAASGPASAAPLLMMAAPAAGAGTSAATGAFSMGVGGILPGVPDMVRPPQEAAASGPALALVPAPTPAAGAPAGLAIEIGDRCLLNDKRACIVFSSGDGKAGVAFDDLSIKCVELSELRTSVSVKEAPVGSLAAVLMSPKPGSNMKVQLPGGFLRAPVMTTQKQPHVSADPNRTVWWKGFSHFDPPPPNHNSNHLYGTPLLSFSVSTSSPPVTCKPPFLDVTSFLAKQSCALGVPWSPAKERTLSVSEPAAGYHMSIQMGRIWNAARGKPEYRRFHLVQLDTARVAVQWGGIEEGVRDGVAAPAPEHVRPSSGDCAAVSKAFQNACTPTQVATGLAARRVTKGPARVDHIPGVGAAKLEELTDEQIQELLVKQGLPATVTREAGIETLLSENKGAEAARKYRPVLHLEPPSHYNCLLVSCVSVSIGCHCLGVRSLLRFQSGMRMTIAWMDRMELHEI